VRAAAMGRAALEDEVGPEFVDDLLINPQIEWALEHRGAEPGGLGPRALEVVRVVEEQMEVVHNAPLAPAAHVRPPVDGVAQGDQLCLDSGQKASRHAC